MPREAPLTIGEAEHRFAPLKGAGRILIAVSGGPDSVALMNFAAAIRRHESFPPLAVATVDHRLQAGSDRIARDVADQADALGLDAHILPWEGIKPATGVQAAARQARYELLIRLADRIDATHLVTAHTLDDQAETILFRMARGSGLAGLAGMRPAVMRGRIIHYRPFLEVAKQRLVEACRANHWSFVEDPANRDLRFARARMRRLLPLLAAEGLDAKVLATLGWRVARTAAAIGEKAETALEESRLPSDADRQAFAASRLLAEPTVILVRALEMSLTGFAHDGPPRLGRLESLVDDLEKAYRRGRSFRRTLHGAIVSWRGGSAVEIARETRRHPHATSGSKG